MIFAIVVILFLLWLMGYGPFTVLQIALFSFNGLVITIWDILIFLVMIWLAGILPRPFREIASVLIIVWVLSLFGIIAVAGLSSLLIIAVIAGVILYILTGAGSHS